MSETLNTFAVVIPLYNKESTVENAIRSVLNQTIQDFEIVVVNDGSTDNGPNIVETIDDFRIRLIHQKNQGVSSARNRGIIESKNDLIAFLDADDEWLPEFLETIRRMAVRYPECGLYATGYYMGLHLTEKRVAILKKLPFNFEGILAQYFNVALVSEPPLWSSAIAVRKAALNKIGGFPVGIRMGEDLLTWAKLALQFPIAYSAIPRVLFRQEEWHLYLVQPQRLPDDGDPVGTALKQLSYTCPHLQKRSFRKYIALWHKMRLSLFVRAGMKKASVGAWFYSVMFNPFQFKVHLLLASTIIGRRARKILFTRMGSHSRQEI